MEDAMSRSRILSDTQNARKLDSSSALYGHGIHTKPLNYSIRKETSPLMTASLWTTSSPPNTIRSEVYSKMPIRINGDRLKTNSIRVTRKAV
jgi:hypothetical protein